jgi:putative membrane protein
LKPENHRQKEILQAQYKIMTYRLWYIITFCYISKYFAYWMLFFTDLGKAWLQMPWMHVKLGFVFALYLYHGKCQQIFNQLQNDKLNTLPILCAYGTGYHHSFAVVF